ncbi:MAG: hypothetical protein MUO76_03340 [Anaerolineaceae bacterium]|nr:hypothetical protein [Anaerolineaceae bacterium]
MYSIMSRLPDQLSRWIRLVVSLRHTVSAMKPSQPSNRIGGMLNVWLGSAGAVGTTYSSGYWGVGIDVGPGYIGEETNVGEPVVDAPPGCRQAAQTIDSTVKMTNTWKVTCRGCP